MRLSFEAEGFFKEVLLLHTLTSCPTTAINNNSAMPTYISHDATIHLPISGDAVKNMTGGPHLKNEIDDLR